MSEILEETCSGCEGDECCQIQDDLRNPEYSCPLPEIYSKLEGDAFVYFSTLHDIKKHMESIPKRFVSEAYTVLNRATLEHAVWDFEEWFNKLNELLGPIQSSTPKVIKNDE